MSESQMLSEDDRASCTTRKSGGKLQWTRLDAMKHGTWTRRLCIVLTLICAYRPLAHAELHHQRPLPRPSPAIEAAEAISLHANASRATFAIGDHLISWLADHPTQYVTRRRVADVTKEDVVFIVMVGPCPSRACYANCCAHRALYRSGDRGFRALCCCMRAGKQRTKGARQNTEGFLDALGRIRRRLLGCS